MSALPEVLYGRNSGHRTDDGLSSVRKVVNSSGVSQGEFKFDEFGVPETSTTPAADLSAHSYVGGLGQRNEGGGMYYARQRWYDSSLGRWLSVDPIGFAGGLNLYTMVGNSPVNYTDPLGLQPQPSLIADPLGVSHPELGRPGSENAGTMLLVGAGICGAVLAPEIYVWLLHNPEAVLVIGPFAMEFAQPGSAPAGIGTLAANEARLLGQVEQVAARNGLNLSGVIVKAAQSAPARTTFGFINRCPGGKSLVSEGGKVVLNITKIALKSPRNLVMTLKHELKHIDDFAATGRMPEPSSWFDIKNWLRAR